MEAASAPAPTDLVPAVKHFVKHNPIDEERWHLGAVQGGMHPNNSVFDREAAHLDGSLLRTENRRPPGDLCPQLALEVSSVQAIEDALQVVESVQPAAVSPGAAGVVPD